MRARCFDPQGSRGASSVPQGSGRRSLGVACAAAVAGLALLPAPEARADSLEDIAFIALGLGLVGGNVAFTVYDGIVMDAGEEPAPGASIAQTIIGGIEMLAITGISTAITLDDPDEGAELAFLPLATWVGTLGTFGAWSLADSTTVDAKGRFGLSSVLAMNMYFTALNIATLADGRASPDYFSIPEVTLMAPECVLTTWKAVTDPAGRDRWVPLAVWSGALTLHGFASLVVRGLEFERSSSGSYALPLPTPMIGTPEGPVPGMTMSGVF